MFTPKRKVNTRICAVLLVLSFLVPVHTHAQSATQFQPQTREQIIAYLYGQITQLQILLAQKIAEEKNGSDSSADQNSRSDVRVETLTAQNVTDDSVTLRGEVDLNREDEAFVWFEYTDENGTQKKTTAKRITDSRGDEQVFTASLSSLKSDERYTFRAVVEDEEGEKSYGARNAFITDGGSNNNDADLELIIADRSIEVGDSVKVQWQLPQNDVDSQNWIGIYVVGDSNRDFVVWKYIPNDEGSVSMRINESGTYEARLFFNNSYNDELTSQSFTVSR